jgi:hypothetical protein
MILGVNMIDCGHDGEDTDFNCSCCQEAIKQSILDAGIPLSVIEGNTKLKDHFSSEYIKYMCNKESEE